MTSQIIPVPEFDLVIFGSTGDLSYRKIVPALYQRHRDGQVIGECRIIGASRRAMSTQEWRDACLQAIETHVADKDRDGDSLAGFLDRLTYVTVDALGEDG